MNKAISFILRELLEMLPATIFFLIVFHMIMLTQNVILEGHNLSVTGSAVATISALIVAKSILLVEALPIVHWFSHRLWQSILWKTLLFGGVAVFFRLLEEIVPVLFGDQDLSAALAEKIADMSWSRFWLLQMWLISSLLVYCVASELVREIGTDKVRMALFGERQRQRG